MLQKTNKNKKNPTGNNECWKIKSEFDHLQEVYDFFKYILYCSFTL